MAARGHGRHNEHRPLNSRRKLRNQPVSWDAEDIAQELRLRVLEAEVKFDPERGLREAFATVVERNARRTLVREWSAAKRNERHVCSLDGAFPWGAGESTPLSQSIATPRPHGRDHDLEVDLRIDLSEFIDQLPAPLQEFMIALGLEKGNLEATKRRLGVTSWVARTRLALLRESLVDHGFASYDQR